MAILDHSELQVKRFDWCFSQSPHAKAKLRHDIKRLAELQSIFYASEHYALLIVLQGMDAAGKDGAIKHAMTGVNPQGVDVSSFKVPSTLELDHDYLWRTTNALPPSYDEQRKRLLARIDTPEKNWKLSASDVHERTFWNNYQRAYEEMLEHTSTDWAPWYIVPADHKWFTRVAVAGIVVAKLESLGLVYPQVGDEQRAHLAALGEQLRKSA